MTDAPRVVDDIRSYCQGADQVLSDGLRETAAAYRDACQVVNQRLRRCDEFLQKGLRSEALHLAEAEPPLLDSLAALDFPERGQWDELAASYGLPAAPKLNVAAAEALNRAYAEDEPLRRPLREHRRLNIVRAPLLDRLAALRRLHQLDAGNPVWPEDIRIFEMARHGELGGEVEEAISGHNFVGLSRCWDEVQNTPWLAAPPPALVGRLRSIYLREIGDELYRLFKEQDFPRAQRLRDHWERLDPKSAFGPTSSVWDRVNLCLDWVRREEGRQSRRLEFETALMELEQALGKEWTTPERLRDLYIQVTDFRIRVPTAVEERYTARVGDIRRKADSRERIILVVSFAVGAVVLVTLLLFAFLRRR